MTRKSTLLLLFTVLLTATAAWAVTVTYFQATLDGTSVRVEWEVLNETGVTGFEVHRRSGNEAFTRLTSVTPSGQRRYQYLDANLYRGTSGTSGTNGGPYTYRLAVRTTNGEQSYTTVLSQTPSSVQRSWGSIKSMFR